LIINHLMSNLTKRWFTLCRDVNHWGSSKPLPVWQGKRFSRGLIG
jgi:hypothetical protein